MKSLPLIESSLFNLIEINRIAQAHQHSKHPRRANEAHQNESPDVIYIIFTLSCRSLSFGSLISLIVRRVQIFIFCTPRQSQGLSDYNCVLWCNLQW